LPGCMGMRDRGCVWLKYELLAHPRSPFFFILVLVSPGPRIGKAAVH
jgi:hypothetical protein